jgi:hypothetical protein
MRAGFDHRAMAARMLVVYEQVLAVWEGDARGHRGRWDDVVGVSGAEPAAVKRILDRIAAHVTGSADNGSTTPSIGRRTQRIRELIEGFRREPFGGRLLRLKRVVYWFTASAFDRQTKIHESLLPAIVEVEQELAQLRLELAEAEAARHFFDDRDRFRREPLRSDSSTAT